MNHCIENCVGSAEQGWQSTASERFPDPRNRYKIRWRDALRAIAAPVERLHRYRNLRSAMFYDAIERLDRQESSSGTTRQAGSNDA